MRLCLRMHALHSLQTLEEPSGREEGCREGTGITAHGFRTASFSTKMLATKDFQGLSFWSTSLILRNFARFSIQNWPQAGQQSEFWLEKPAMSRG